MFKYNDKVNPATFYVHSLKKIFCKGNKMHKALLKNRDSIQSAIQTGSLSTVHILSEVRSHRGPPAGEGLRLSIN